MRVTGWRAAVRLLVGVVVLLVLFVLALWLAVVLAIVAAVAALNLVCLPRLAHRLRAPRPVLDVACLVLLAGAGWLLDGASGAAIASVGWLGGIGLPRLAGWRLLAGSEWTVSTNVRHRPRRVGAVTQVHSASAATARRRWPTAPRLSLPAVPGEATTCHDQTPE